MRWSNAKIGRYEIVPLKRQGKLVIGKKQYVHESPYSRLLVIRGSKEVEVDYPAGVNIGQAVSSIMSFAMRCSVISYNENFPIFRPEIDRSSDKEDLSLPAVCWAENWKDMLGLKPGATMIKSLRRYLLSYIPSPEEEQNLVKSMGQIYEILMKIDEKLCYSIIGAMRLYQLALNAARVDLSLAYSLLVAAVDAASSGWKAKIKMWDIDPEGKLTKVMEELQFDEQLQGAVKDRIISHESLTRRFSNFIVENLPSTFWEGDHSMIKELDLHAESLRRHYHSGQFLQDIADSVPDPQRQELLRRAEEEKESYEEFFRQMPERRHTWIINDDRRKWMMDYIRTHLDRVLRNTFGSRSELFHRGRGFPKIGLKEEFTDWIPDVFEEDYREFIWEHSEHTWNYSMDKKTGKIFRSCSCDDRKEVKVLLGIHVFERMVHDSIFNYLLKLNYT